MDISTLASYAVPVIVGICVCVGYVLHSIVPTNKVNKYIPLIMAVLGVGLNCWIAMSVSPDIILGGMFSGLASTGMYEVFSQLIVGKAKDAN